MSRRSRLTRTVLGYPSQVPGQHDEGVRQVQYLRQYLKNRPLDLASGGDTWYSFLNSSIAPAYLKQVGSSVPLAKKAMKDDDWDYIEKIGNAVEKLLTEADQEKAMEWLNRNDPGNLPTWMLMDSPKPVNRMQWLVHFSHDADQISAKGFTKGRYEVNALALTNHLGDAKYPGFNFAFIADSYEARSASNTEGYGGEAVMFRAIGIEAYHGSDGEEQVMFWGPSVPVSEIVYLYRARDSSDWCVGQRRSNGQPIYQGKFSDVVAWVEQHFDQYRKALAM